MVKRIRLQDRDRAILAHIQRFKMTTSDVLQSHFFQGKGDDAVTSTLRRLRAAEYICSADLSPPNRKYYHLSPRSTRMLGIPASFGRPLGEQALPMRFATLQFCCSDGASVHLMEREEFAEDFPGCVDDSLPLEPYYLDETDGVARLAFLIVDLGAEAGRIVRKCRKAYGQREQVAGFRELLNDDAFIVTVLTGQESKKSAIEAAWKRAKDFERCIRVAVIPRMSEVL